VSHPEEPRTEPPLVVPRQRRRDAYTLYAEIYALQRELNRTGDGPST
jgi:hypothetical protein